MLTIKTKPDCVLQFIACPRGAEKTVYTYPEGADPLRWKPIGRLSEITEDQAKELLDSLIVNGFCCYKDYVDSTNSYFSASVLMSLKSAALSVGIEEKDFDKILVIKL